MQARSGLHRFGDLQDSNFLTTRPRSMSSRSSYATARLQGLTVYRDGARGTSAVPGSTAKKVQEGAGKDALVEALGSIADWR